jgi:hypothetical protein
VRQNSLVQSKLSLITSNWSRSMKIEALHLKKEWSSILKPLVLLAKPTSNRSQNKNKSQQQYQKTCRNPLNQIKHHKKFKNSFNLMRLHLQLLHSPNNNNNNLRKKKMKISNIS